MTLILNGTSGITDVDGSASAPALTGTDTDTGVFFPAANTLGLSTGGTERARIDSSGNLGLGVTPSAWDASIFTTLQVRGASFFAGVNSPSDAFVGSNFYYGSGSYRYIATGSASFYRQASGEHYWGRAGSGTAGNAITFTQAMTLDASGNFMVATTSPSYTSSGRGNITIGGSSNSMLGFQVGGAAKGYVYHNGTDMFVSNDAAGALAFYTNASERARIDSSGNLLVGTTSTTQSHKMVGLVANAWSLQVFSTFATGSQNYGIQVAYTNAAPNSTVAWFYQGVDNSAGRFTVYSNGGIANYQANNTNLSDRREKTNFAAAGNYLEKICAIPVQTFNYIDQNLEEDGGLTLGVVAQDVQAVAPELVMESNWGTQEEPKMRLSVYQTDLQYALMKSIQELKAIVDAQAAEIAALKGQA